MPGDYIPASDADFRNFEEVFRAAVGASPADYGLVVGEITALDAAGVAFEDDYAMTLDPATRTSVQIANKNASRATLEGLIRVAAGKAQAKPATDPQLVAAGLPVHDAVPTVIDPPATKPVVSVERINNLSHTLRIRDESTPLLNARPPGAIGAEVYVSYGTTEPLSVADMSYQLLATRALVEVPHAPSAKGEDAWFVARWITARGERGPVSDQISATVAG